MIQCIKWFHKAKQRHETWKRASILLADAYSSRGFHYEALDAVTNVNTKAAENYVLSLQLTLNNRDKFNQQANRLINNNLLDERGRAAIDHANILYNQTLVNGRTRDTLDSIVVQKISEKEFSSELLREMVAHLVPANHQPRDREGLVVNGFQTSGNILETPKKSFKLFRELLLQKIETYNHSMGENADEYFMENWHNKMYKLVVGH